MGNLFKEASKGILSSTFVIPITLVFVIMFITAAGISYEDYSTTFEGYKLVPTAKVNEWAITLVALLPQIGQIGFAYVFASDSKKGWAALLVIILHVVDVYTDVRFKANGQDLGVYLIAWVESEVVYTIGSEIALAVSIGMLFQLLPTALGQLLQFLRRFMEALSSDDQPTSSQPSTPPQTQYQPYKSDQHKPQQGKPVSPVFGQKK